MKPEIATTSRILQNQIDDICMENRKQERMDAGDLSQILFNNRSFGCLVVNLSACGALLNVSTIQVPDKFILMNFGINRKAACKVVWRDHYLIGVRFITKLRLF